MSPEVRFTRTPERVLKERRMKGVSHPSEDPIEEQARQIAAARMDDPAPAVQERLQALRSKAASQETGADTPRIFNRAPASERGPITRAATPDPAAEVPNPAWAGCRAGASAEGSNSRRSLPRAIRSRRRPMNFRRFSNPIASCGSQGPISWIPRSSLFPPCLSRQRAKKIAQPARKAAAPVKAAPPVRAVTPVPSRAPLPAQPEIAPWDDDEDYVEEALSDDGFDDEDIVEEAPRRAAVVTQPRVSPVPAVPVPANDSFRRDNYASVSSVSRHRPEPPSITNCLHSIFWRSRRSGAARKFLSRCCRRMRRRSRT